MIGSKRSVRGVGSFKQEVKFSLKRNKKLLNRRARHKAELKSGNAYRRLAKDKAWEYVS